MTNLIKFSVMPTKLKYKVMVSFCLMSIVPMLVGTYIASIVLKYDARGLSPATVISITLVILFSLLLSFLGFHVTKQLTDPIVDVNTAARNIAEGRLDQDQNVEGSGADELEELSQSLKMITRNARELLDKVDMLSLKDKLTGLYNANYIRERLGEEIQRAVINQTPCAFAFFHFVNYDVCVQRFGVDSVEEYLKAIASIFNKNIAQLDRVARLNKGDFAAIYPGRNKKSAIEISERICRDISQSEFAVKAKAASLPLAVCVGISENPLDGMSAELLYIKAQERMKLAKSKGDGGIEAFV